MDETTLKLHPYLCKQWMKRGQQKRVATPGQQKASHVFGAYDWCRDQIIWLTSTEKNTSTFKQFIEQFMAQIKTDRPIFWVMDNASFHHSRESKATLAFFEDDKLVATWLPPYCSDLNPIERFWLHLKRSATANKLFESMENLVTSVEKFLHLQNDASSPNKFLFLKTSLR